MAKPGSYPKYLARYCDVWFGAARGISTYLTLPMPGAALLPRPDLCLDLARHVELS